MRKIIFLKVVIFSMVIWTREIVASEIKINGFAQAQIINDVSQIDKEVSFTLKRARIIAKGNLNDKVGLFSQLETFPQGLLLDLVIDYDLGLVGKIGIGRFTKPFGLQNPVSPYNLHTINYSQVVSKLIGGGGRDFGLRLAGKFGKLDWVFAIINGAINATDDNSAKDIVGRLGISIIKGLGTGVSIYNGKVGVEKTAVERLGIDLKYEKDDFYTQLEYINGKDGKTEKSGYYLELGCKIKKLQPIIRYEVYDGDTNIKDLSEIKIVAIGANYYINESAKLQLIYESKKDKIGKNFIDVKNDVCIFQTAVKF